jgi:hypothetical protein
MKLSPRHLTGNEVVAILVAIAAIIVGVYFHGIWSGPP